MNPQSKTPQHTLLEENLLSSLDQPFPKFRKAAQRLQQLVNCIRSPNCTAKESYLGVLLLIRFQSSNAFKAQFPFPSLKDVEAALEHLPPVRVVLDLHDPAPTQEKLWGLVNHTDDPILGKGEICISAFVCQAIEDDKQNNPTYPSVLAIVFCHELAHHLVRRFYGGKVFQTPPTVGLDHGEGESGLALEKFLFNGVLRVDWKKENQWKLPNAERYLLEVPLSSGTREYHFIKLNQWEAFWQSISSGSIRSLDFTVAAKPLDHALKPIVLSADAAELVPGYVRARTGWSVPTVKPLIGLGIMFEGDSPDLISSYPGRDKV